MLDHLLSRLQEELQKSRETGAELHNLMGAMNDIHDTLGGSLVSGSCYLFTISDVFFSLPIYLPPPPCYLLFDHPKIKTPRK
jgi:hypothetical protein